PVLGTPKPEAPALGTPKPEAPVLGTPKPEAPVLGTPKPEAPVLGTPKPEAPAPDAPAPNGQGADGPAGAPVDVLAEASAGHPDHAPGAARTSRPDPDRRKPTRTDVPDPASAAMPAAMPADLSAPGANASRATRD
ncbi:MFS transporter, partial [Streptomyces sp. NPDC060275]